MFDCRLAILPIKMYFETQIAKASVERLMQWLII